MMAAALPVASGGEAAAVDPRNFDAAASNAAILGLDTTWIAPPLTPFFSLEASYANDELVDRSGALGVVLDERVVTTLGVGVAFFDRLELAVSLPFHVGHGADGTESGLGDVRVQPKLRVIGPAHGHAGFGLALGVGVTLPTAGSAPFSGDDGVGVEPRLVLDWRSASGAVVALSAGYRHRASEEVFGLVIGDELRFGLGTELPMVSFGVDAPLSVLAEVEGSIGLDDPGSEPQRALEARLGLRFRSARWSATLASGTGMASGYGTPDFRVVFGLAWGASPIAEPTPLAATSAIEPEPEFAPVTPIAEASSVAVVDPDADVDGVPLGKDACPDEPEDLDQFEDADGCPEPDNDVDGVLDAADRCPGEKEVVNGFVDDDGCADVAPEPAKNDAVARLAAKGPAIRPDGRIELPGPIAFHSGSDVLAPAAAPFIAQVATFLGAHPEVKRLRIEGHTDDMGDKEFNVDLSERRAARVRLALVERGVAADRLLPKGFGPTQPLVPNTSDKNRAKNRRVELRIIEMPGMTSTTTEPQP